MNIKLNVQDRLLLHNLVPQSSSVINMMIWKEITDLVRVSEIEQKQVDFVMSSDADGTIRQRWNIIKAEKLDKDFKISEVMVKTIDDRIEELDNKKSINMNMLSIIKKFRDAAKSVNVENLDEKDKDK